MKFDQYQRKASQTSQQGTDPKSGKIVSMLGLAGETGQLLSEYKKFLRDGDAHQLHKERAAEELGDLLWYLSEVASQFGLSLDKIARSNLKKIDARWGQGRSTPTGTGANTSFDKGYPAKERLPREGEAEIRPISGSGKKRIETYVNGRKMGQDLTDNAHTEDGYRLHDIFHLACMTLLGWSPAIRRGLKAKRKSNPSIDEVEDGGRALVIEEGVSALVFVYALRHKMLAGIGALDYPLLRTIKQMTDHLEVSVRGEGDWEQTIIAAYEVWREATKHGGARIAFDADNGIFKFIGPPRARRRAPLKVRRKPLQPR